MELTAVGGQYKVYFYGQNTICSIPVSSRDYIQSTGVSIRIRVRVLWHHYFSVLLLRRIFGLILLSRIFHYSTLYRTVHKYLRLSAYEGLDSNAKDFWFGL